MSLQSNLLLNSKLWLQQYSSSLNMAFGKKSFLIRDILENRSQSMPSLSSTSLIDWIIRNRVDYFGQGFNFTENNQLEVDTNADTQLLSCDPPEQDSFNANLAFNPLLQNWFSFYRPNSLISASSSEQPSATSPEIKSTFNSNLYQNLYYYAIQQQISASFDNIQSEDNFVDQSNTSNLGAIQTKTGKCKNSKAKRSLPITAITAPTRKRPSTTKPKKVNKIVMKKMKNTEVFVINQAAPIDGLLKTEDEHASDWAGESSECKCNVNDDLQEMDGINCCGAKSKCKKLRRNRTVFTELQLMGLERRFDSQKYLSTPDRADLARALGLTQLQVKTWYQNRRMKWKKQVMQQGCPYPPTKPKGRPKKDSIPTYGIEFTNSILCPIFASHNSSSSASPNQMPTLLPSSFGPNISPLAIS